MVLVALALVCQSGLLRGAAPPVYVTLWFDTEDYILPQDDDATKRLAGMLTRLGVRATFKIVGEKARVLEQRGRTDVIAALQQHDIGYHSNTHSQQPTIAVYLASALRRGEAAALRDQLTTISDALPALVSFVDRTERYQYVNAEYERLLATREDEESAS